MKKYLFILVLALICSRAFAQNTRFTVFVDPKFSWMNSDLTAIENDGTKIGINIGLNVDKFFAKNYAITTGISINNVGGNLKFADSTNIQTNADNDIIPAGESMEYKLQYINIPLGLKLKTNEIGYLTFFTHLGINSGINIKATGEGKGFDLENENISDEIKLFNLGYFIGAGVEYSIGGNAAVVLGLTYTNGFVDITDDSNSKVTLSNIAIRIGVLF